MSSTAARPITGVSWHLATYHASRNAWKQLVERATSEIRAALEHMQRPYVAFSCGKDSCVLAHLVLAVAPHVPLRFLSSGETRLMHDVDGVLDWFRARGGTVEEINIDRVFSDEWKDASWDEQRAAGRGDLARLSDGAYDGVFLGLRAEESRVRAASLATHRSAGLPRSCYRYRNGVIRCCPLAFWRTPDIHAYLALHEIPVLAWYHEHGMGARTTARLTGDAARQFVLTHMQRSNPAGFRALVNRFPELRIVL